MGEQNLTYRPFGKWTLEELTHLEETLMGRAGVWKDGVDIVAIAKDVSPNVSGWYEYQFSEIDRVLNEHGVRWVATKSDGATGRKSGHRDWDALYGPAGRVSLHVLRHTAIATINDNTGDPWLAQMFARHEDPSTTAMYTRTLTDKLVGGVEGLDSGSTNSR